MEKEIWKPIKGYEEYYEVSNLGRVKSLAKTWSVGRKGITILKLGHRSGGYDFVVLCVDKVKKYASVHRLVALHFCSNTNNLNVVNHIDCDIYNNKATNLEWTTSSGNTIHSYKMGRRASTKGENHPLCKLSENDILNIRLNCRNGVNQRYIAKEYGIAQGQVSKINTKERWSHIS